MILNIKAPTYDNVSLLRLWFEIKIYREILNEKSAIPRSTETHPRDPR